jgi:tRNA dimethylallyltransferase
MQIYRELPILTAQPSRDEVARAPHYLIRVTSLRKRFSVAMWREAALEAIEHCIGRNIAPIVCGGTRLYYKALTQGLFEQTVRDSEIRRELEFRVRSVGSSAMHQELASVDPRAAERIHPNDAKRIVRALEVYQATGMPISELQRQAQNRGEAASLEKRGTMNRHRKFFRYRLYILTGERQWLYNRVNERVDEMVAAGLLEEVRAVLDAGMEEDCYRVRAHGVREVAEYLRGQRTLGEALDAMRQMTRRYVKYQLMWLRQETGGGSAAEGGGARVLAVDELGIQGAVVAIAREMQNDLGVHNAMKETC